METKTKTSVFFGLMAEFGSGHVPLVDIAESYFGMSAREARVRAARNELPVPVYRVGSRKSPWFVSVEDLAAHIEDCLADGRERWKANNKAEAA